MGLRDKLKRLEREAGPLSGTLQLPDGQEVSYQRQEMLEALLAALEHREHRLLPYLRQMPGREGMPGLIKALEAGKEQYGD